MIKYKFFDKHCHIDRALSNRSNLEVELRKLHFNFSDIAFVNQIHSNIIYVIDDKNKIPEKQGLPAADAIVTNLKNVAIAVFTADCTPLLLKDEKEKIIAVIHAGWKGAKADIIANAVKEMKKLGSKIENISAIIGPMIHQKSYQVSQEFYDDFLKADKKNAQFFIIDKSTPTHYLFDLPAFVINKLKSSGIDNIGNINIDTYQSLEHSSYRRSTHKKEADCGRNISLIMIE